MTLAGRASHAFLARPVRWVIAAAAVVWICIAIFGWPGETSNSYCHDLYHSGPTPGWATDSFHDYDSCVAWYERNEPHQP